MKGISAMVATVLLLAFTVAVGGIVSVWLTGMTRTQTAGVTTAAQCASTRFDMTADLFGNTTGGLIIKYTNLGPEVVYPKNITVTCGAITGTATPTETSTGLAVGQSNSLSIAVSGCVTNNNLTVRMAATCGSDQKGTVLAECKNTNC